MNYRSMTANIASGIPAALFGAAHIVAVASRRFPGDVILLESVGRREANVLTMSFVAGAVTGRELQLIWRCGARLCRR